MKIILTLFLINYFGIFSQNVTREQKIKISKKLMMKDIALTEKMHDGPMTKEEMGEYEKNQKEKSKGKASGKSGVVYIARNLREMPLGNTRVRSNGLALFYPDEQVTKKLQNKIDTDEYQDLNEFNRLKIERDVLKAAEEDPAINPYEQILEKESSTLNSKNGYSRLNNSLHKKNLLILAIKKQEEIVNNMIESEKSSVVDRKFNAAFYTNPYKSRLREEKKLEVEKESQPKDEKQEEKQKKLILPTNTEGDEHISMDEVKNKIDSEMAKVEEMMS